MLEDFVIAIRLTGVKPRVGRQVQVSGELGLRRFHQVIQAAMGWEDAAPHLWRGLYDDFGDLRQFVPPGPEDERKANNWIGHGWTFASLNLNLSASKALTPIRLKAGCTPRFQYDLAGYANCTRKAHD